MSKETEKLAQSFATKEEVDGFLSNLEQLKAEGSVTEEQYAKFKQDYQQRLDTIASEIAQVKSDIKKELETVQRDIETYRWELGKIETKYKVGELPLDKYQGTERDLRARLEGFETSAAELTRLIEANSSADIGVAVKKPAAAAAPPAVTTGPLSCPKCGAQLRPTASFCNKCGTPVTYQDVPSPAGAATPTKKGKPPKTKTPGPPFFTTAMPSAQSLLTPWTKLMALSGGVLLLISIFLPCVAASELLGKELGSASGMGVSAILGASGIVCGLVAVTATIFLAVPKARGIIQIVMGSVAVVALLAIMFTGILPLHDELYRTLVVIREGFYLYVIAAIVLIAAGLLERRHQ